MEEDKQRTAGHDMRYTLDTHKDSCCSIAMSADYLKQADSVQALLTNALVQHSTHEHPVEHANGAAAALEAMGQ